MVKKQKDKIEKLNSVYTYNGDDELLCDISTTNTLTSDITTKIYTCVCGKEYKTKNGYNKHIEKCDIYHQNEEVKKVKEIKIQPTNKEILESMINIGKPFILKMSGNIIFDSEQDNISLLHFSNDFFQINNKKLTYNGLNIKYKK